MRYYIKDDGETAEDAEELGKSWDDDVPGFAEAAAEHIWNNRDGWERSWPVSITVIDDNGKEVDFSVDMEPVPTFHASVVANAAH